MTTRVTLAHSPDKDLARCLPMTGAIERVVRAKDGQAWQLLRLERPVALTGGTCGWLLVRARETTVDDEGTEVTTFDVLRAAPRIADGFDAAIFERLGRARTHPPRDSLPAPPPRPSWRGIGIATAVLAVGGWLFWQFADSPYFPMKLVIRVLFAILGSLK